METAENRSMLPMNGNDPRDGAFSCISGENPDEWSACEAYPDAYRLSEMTEEEIDDFYREGKENMSASDLLAYYHETELLRTRNRDFSADGLSDAAEEDLLPAEPKQARDVVGGAIRSIRKTCAGVGQRIRSSCPTWFDAGAPDTAKNKKTFPLSAFAAIAAVAVSMMLIVASAILTTRGESLVNETKEKVSAATSELIKMKSDLDAGIDRLQVRNLAAGELGMIDESFVRTEFLDFGATDSVETYPESRTGGIGLDALLSGIGVK